MNKNESKTDRLITYFAYLSSSQYFSFHAHFFHLNRAVIKSSSRPLGPRDACLWWRPWEATVATWQPALVLLSGPTRPTSTKTLSTSTTSPWEHCCTPLLTLLLHLEDWCQFLIVLLTDQCGAFDWEDEEGHPARPCAQVCSSFFCLVFWHIDYKSAGLCIYSYWVLNVYRVTYTKLS